MMVLCMCSGLKDAHLYAQPILLDKPQGAMPYGAVVVQRLGY